MIIKINILNVDQTCKLRILYSYTKSMADDEEEYHSMTWFWILLFIFIFVVFVVIPIIFLAVYFWKHKAPSPSVPQTTVATSGGTKPDGSNSTSMYSGDLAGTTMFPPGTTLTCGQVFNSNYVGYKIVNGSTATQSFAIYNYFGGNTQCGGSGVTYTSPRSVAPGTSLYWTDNTINNTQFSFYYNSIVYFKSTLNTTEYYLIGNQNNTNNPINAASQYLLVSIANNGDISYSAVPIGT